MASEGSIGNTILIEFTRTSTNTIHHTPSSYQSIIFIRFLSEILKFFIQVNPEIDISNKYLLKSSMIHGKYEIIEIILDINKIYFELIKVKIIIFRN